MNTNRWNNGCEDMMGREIQVSNVEVRKIVGFIPSPFDMIYCLLVGHNLTLLCAESWQ